MSLHELRAGKIDETKMRTKRGANPMNQQNIIYQAQADSRLVIGIF
jgi:hypothetical protein